MNSIERRLRTLAENDQQEGIRHKFASNSNRALEFSHELSGVYYDFSKTHISEDLLTTYADLAKEIGFKERRLAMFRGDRINSSEGRSVLHALLRSSSDNGIAMNNSKIVAQASQAKDDLDESYIRVLERLESRDVPVRSIIHVGIGGSALGPRLIYQALKGLDEHIDIHFVSNIDGHELSAVLADCEVTSTIVIGVSKTFTTAETLQNIRSIGVWYKEQGINNYLDSVVGITASPENAKCFGISDENIVVFPNWVGGRYSVWSSVSLSVALVLGIDMFKEFLRGAAAMDQYFINTEPKENISFIAAALDHYYVNYFNAQSRAVFAYDYRLRSVVDYLQQLETESNGKDRDINGLPVCRKTSPVVWGGVGTDVQHSVFQLLHQGTIVIPSEFILTSTADHQLDEHHAELLANGIAQTAALLQGQSLDDVKNMHQDGKLNEIVAQAKVFSGNRPSTTIMLDRLNPRALGALLAFYEHRTFCFGVLCNINSFDQMGVELGKRLATQVRPNLDASNNNQAMFEFDSSTRALISRVKKNLTLAKD